LRLLPVLPNRRQPSGRVLPSHLENPMARRRRKASVHNRAEGRHAARPRDIPAKGWRQIALRVKDELSKDNISIVAAGIAFHGLLAIFPAIAALVSIYGLIADPADIENH